MKPLSIVMTAYNTSKYIHKAVLGVLNQTFKDFELIIVNDASTDNTLEIVEAIEDPRILIVDNPSNSGTYFSRNLGMLQANGKYIAFLDSDDFISPNRFKRIIEFLDTNEEIMHIETRYVRFYDSSEELWFRTWTRGVGFAVIRKEVVDDLGYFLPVRASGDMEYAHRIKCHYGNNRRTVLNHFTYWAVQRGESLTQTIVPEKRDAFLDYTFNKFHKSNDLLIEFPFTKKTMEQFKDFPVFSPKAANDPNHAKILPQYQGAIPKYTLSNDDLSKLLRFCEESLTHYYTQFLKLERASKQNAKHKKIKNNLPKWIQFLYKVDQKIRKLVK